MASNKASLMVDLESFLQRDGSLLEFLQRVAGTLTPTTLLGLIGVEIEHLFRQGKPISLPEYSGLLPENHQGEIGAVCAESVGNFIQTFCPIRDSLGTLPVQFERFIFIREISRGGCGVVYEVHNTALDRRSAVKVLFKGWQTSNDEAKILASFNHPNICSIFDAGTIGGHRYLEMQLVDGPSLSHFCQKPSMLGTKQAVLVVTSILKTLMDCHEQGIVHMDLKPSNVLMSEMKPVIIDFGLACQSGYSHSMFGSPDYMAPELMDGNNTFNPVLCDTYSVGVILYELLTGQRPKVANRNSSSTRKKQYPQTKSVRKINAAVDKELSRICDKATSHLAINRYRSARAFMVALEDWTQKFESTGRGLSKKTDESPEAKTSSATPPKPHAPRAKRKRLFDIRRRWI